jgi:hypothetical protein
MRANGVVRFIQQRISVMAMNHANGAQVQYHQPGDGMQTVSP